MVLFKHKHKKPRFPTDGKAIMKCSLVTGIPIQIGSIRIYACRCGEIMETEKILSGAGEQQLSWGATEESLWDDGPIRES